jgi:pentatricopeptide repeat protein
VQFGTADETYGKSEEYTEDTFARFADSEDPAIVSLRAAQASGSNKEVLKAIQRFRQSDRSTQSLAAFNCALSLFVQSKLFITSMEEIYSTYLQLVESGFTPNSTTYTYMIRALCYKDVHEQFRYRTVNRRRGVHEGDEYAQAVSMFNIAHGVQKDRIGLASYVAMLESCAIRGDVKQAALTMDKLVANGLRLPPGDMYHLIECLSNDSRSSAKESFEEMHVRIVKSCREVMSESEIAHANASFDIESGRSDPIRKARTHLWNTMIRAAMRHFDTPLALNLVEMMVNGTPLQKECLPAPMPNASTGTILINTLANRGDILAAYEWIERLVDLSKQSKDAGDASLVMPLPSFKEGIAKVFEKAASREISDSLQENPNLAVEHIDHALQSLPVIKKIFQSGVLSNLDEQHEVLISARRLIFFHLHLVEALQKLPDAHTDDIKHLQDSCMEFLPCILEGASFGLAPAGKSEQTITDAFANFVSLSHRLFDVLFEAERYADAAAVVSYSLAFNSLQAEEGALGNQVSNAKAARSRRAEQRMVKLVELAINSTERQHAQAFYCALGFCLPLVKAETGSAASADVVVEAYLHARKVIKPSEADMSIETWAALLGVFVDVTRADVSLPEDAPFTFAEDIMSLPTALRETLDLSAFLVALKKRYSATAVERLSQIGFDVPEVGSPDRQTTLSSLDASEFPETEATSEGESTTTITTEGLLEGYVPVNNLSKDISTLPDVQIVDEDHGLYCLKLVNAGAGRSRPDSSRNNLDHAYRAMTNAIDKEGRYPTVTQIAELIVLLGRARITERVHHLYLIACHVLGSLGGDPDWQSFSWQALENGMVCALAHAGDAKSASHHRHRLINAGFVPSADAYAALIAVIRDTTDDALIAEELYAESQRLGVVPHVYLYNTVISKMCRARKQERAMQLFNEMLEQGLRPTSVTYGSMINGFTRTGDIASAEQIFSTMENSKNLLVRAPPFNTMIQYFTYTRPDRQKALFYYDKLVQMRVSPTAFTFKLLLDIHGNIEPVDLSALERSFGELIADKNVHVESQHWSSIILAHGVKCGDLERSIAIFEAIPDHLSTKQAQKDYRRAGQIVRDAVTYEALLAVFYHHGRMDLMNQYLAQMSNEGIHLTAYIANTMMQALAGLHQIEQKDGPLPQVLLQDDSGLRQARALFDEMDDPPMGVAAAGNHPPNHRHHANDAGHTIVSDEGRQTTTTFRGVLREPSTFETMIRVELLYGNKEKALEIVDRMSARGYPPALIHKASMLANGMDVQMSST